MIGNYKVVEGSHSGHCCFEASVLDMSKPKYHCDDVNMERDPIDYECVCECFSIEDANLICEILRDRG